MFLILLSVFKSTLLTPFLTLLFINAAALGSVRMSTPEPSRLISRSCIFLLSFIVFRRYERVARLVRVVLQVLALSILVILSISLHFL